ncbi:unnamed protein product, partial [Medioppia subpectinata]
MLRDNHNNGPTPVGKTVENFPPYLSAVLTINHNIYYFFKGSKYCKRPLVVEDNAYSQTPQLDWDNMPALFDESNTDMVPEEEDNAYSQTPQLDWDNMPALFDESNTDMVPEEELKKHFTLTSKDSNCIWKDNRDLLGCKLPKVYNKIRKLCSSPVTIGSVIFDHKLINVFTHLKLYVFDPTGRPKKNMDPAFTRLVSDDTQPARKWPGFDQNYGRFYSTQVNHLCVIYENVRYTCWSADGNKYVDNRPIGPPEEDMEDEEGGDENGDAGALINPEDNGG